MGKMISVGGGDIFAPVPASVATDPHTVGQWYTLSTPLDLAYTKEETARRNTLMRQITDLALGGEMEDDYFYENYRELIVEVRTIESRVRKRAIQVQTSFRLRVLWTDAPPAETEL